MAIIRYPGSKDKLALQIMDYFPTNMRFPLWSAQSPVEYREPFFGAGAVGVRLMQDTVNPKYPVWLNDADPGIAALWIAVWKYPRQLCHRIGNFRPTSEAFFEFKSLDSNHTGDVVEDGFRKLALHRMSVSGFGFMSGGPIGGKHQTNKLYDVGCRWTPSRIKRDVMRVHKTFARFSNLRITCGDFRPLVETAPAESFVYLDPPYYEKGSQLYKHNMSEQDHADLAALLKTAPAAWALSYDDNPVIRSLYEWAQFDTIYVTYTNAIATGPQRPKNREVVIRPTSHAA